MSETLKSGWTGKPSGMPGKGALVGDLEWDGLHRPRIYYAVITTFCGLFLSVLDGTICNVGAERAVSIAELAHLVCTVAGSDSPILTRQRPVPGARVEYYLPDLARAERLGLKPRISLEDALARTFQELRERGTPHADLKDVYS